MNKEFVPYEIALELKELGFDNIGCMGVYHGDSEDVKINADDEEHFELEYYETQYYANKGYKNAVLAPLYQQAIRFLMQFEEIKKWRCNVAVYPDGTYSIKDGRDAIHEYLSGDECIKILIGFIKEK